MCMCGKYWLEPVALARTGRFRKGELAAIAKLVNEYREQLVESWHEFFDA